MIKYIKKNKSDYIDIKIAYSINCRNSSKCQNAYFQPLMKLLYNKYDTHFIYINNEYKYNLTFDVFYQIGYFNNSPIYIKFVYGNDATLYFNCDDHTNINSWLIHFKLITSEKESPIKSNNDNYLVAFYMKNDQKYKIYPDCTFDRWVSRHKQTLLASIDNMMAKNKNPNIRGNYNLGILLHGVPGTGKTSFIRALCNYVNRDAYIVDCDQLSTHDTFQAVFNNYQKHVIVFDEFDHLGPAIREHSSEEKIKYVENDIKKKIDELQEQKMALLCSTMTNNSQQDELKRLNIEIQNVKNSLNLGTIITTLDGMNEMRGRIMVACTNNVHLIAKSIQRPGRFDMVIELSRFTSEEICDYLKMIYKEEITEKEAAQLDSMKFQNNVFTAAELSKLCTVHTFKQILPLVLLNK